MKNLNWTLLGIIAILIFMLSMRATGQQPLYTNCVTVTPSSTNTHTQIPTNTLFPTVTKTNTPTITLTTRPTNTIVPTFTLTPTATHPILQTATELFIHTPTLYFENPKYTYITLYALRVRDIPSTDGITIGVIPENQYWFVFELLDEPIPGEPLPDWQWARIMFNDRIGYFATRANGRDLAIMKLKMVDN